jgi:hypothetical protein
MTPVTSPHKSPASSRTGCSPETRRAILTLSQESQKYFSALWNMLERIDASGSTSQAFKPVLASQLLRLNEQLALIATLVETDSSEILRYVGKNKGQS